MPDRRNVGDFESMMGWSVETWGGHPDLSFFLDSWHSSIRRAEPGKMQPPRNWQRWKIAGARQDHRGDPHDRLRRQAAASSSVRSTSSSRSRDMPIIPIMSYNVFTVMDETYWTGYPTAEGSLHQPGAELVQLPLHDGEAEARHSVTARNMRSGRRERPRRSAPRLKRERDLMSGYGAIS